MTGVYEKFLKNFIWLLSKQMKLRRSFIHIFKNSLTHTCSLKNFKLKRWMKEFFNEMISKVKEIRNLESQFKKKARQRKRFLWQFLLQSNQKSLYNFHLKEALVFLKFMEKIRKIINWNLLDEKWVTSFQTLLIQTVLLDEDNFYWECLQECFQ